MPRIITLLTDFGYNDWFVGVMKGVITSIAPESLIIDITHNIKPGDIRSAAFNLMVSYRFFPKGSIHVVVVDPGVGTARKAIVVQTEDMIFIGPDNGVLSWALESTDICRIIELQNPKWFLKNVSNTFHGRDIFAPVAAHIANGIDIQEFGPTVSDYFKLPFPEPTISNYNVTGEILLIDRFGNGITNITDSHLLRTKLEKYKFFANSKFVGRIQQSYGSVPAGKPLVLKGSTGFYEICANSGSAASMFNLEPKSPVTALLD
jgi:S-adenosylmethionine hydrolase